MSFLKDLLVRLGLRAPEPQSDLPPITDPATITGNSTLIDAPITTRHLSVGNGYAIDQSGAPGAIPAQTTPDLIGGEPYVPGSLAAEPPPVDESIAEQPKPKKPRKKAPSAEQLRMTQAIREKTAKKPVSKPRKAELSQKGRNTKVQSVSAPKAKKAKK